ncbi:winged helix-turn-helix domain-containing protein [Mariniluteicoccus endophyticus]
MSSPLRLSAPAARRIAIAAQGLDRPRLGRPATMRDVQRVIDRLAQFQIDSINVVARAHYLPLYSRLGPYDTALLERAYGRAPRRLFEYWGHAASLVDVTLQPALRFRMAAARDEAWGRMQRIAAEKPDLVARVRGLVADHAPLSSREMEALLDEPEERAREHWGWNWSDTKTAMEFLFWAGEITSAGRNRQFERRFDLPGRVLPPAVVGAPTPTDAEAHLALVRRAAAALGVASVGCLADYFRLPRGAARAAVATLVGTGELLPATVAGWGKPAYLWHAARRPRRVRARALLSPFDSMVFERARLRALFGFDYTIEIYVPEAKRRHGYYVYPFLLGERFAARVDLKADRASDALVVKAAWAEPGLDVVHVAAELMAELDELRSWLGLARIEVVDRGDLAPALVPVGGSRGRVW